MIEAPVNKPGVHLEFGGTLRVGKITGEYHSSAESEKTLHITGPDGELDMPLASLEEFTITEQILALFQQKPEYIVVSPMCVIILFFQGVILPENIISCSTGYEDGHEYVEFPGVELPGAPIAVRAVVDVPNDFTVTIINKSGGPFTLYDLSPGP